MDKEAVKKFNWDELIVTPLVHDEALKGRQVLNFFPGDRDYRNSDSAKEIVAKYFKEAKPINTDAGLLKYGSDQVSIDGFYVEMGVCTGRTINFIAALNPEKIIYGFDSFEGLPEAWVREDFDIPKGTFGFKKSGGLPAVLHNVRLVKGLFSDTLPTFKETLLLDKPIAFLHIDCDLYSSTKEVFEILGDRIVPGTIIVFDEFYNYPGFENHEFKAFHEFLKESKRKAHYIGFNQYFEQVVIRMG